jgi:hypothetical protein
MEVNLVPLNLACFTQQQRSSFGSGFWGQGALQIVWDKFKKTGKASSQRFRRTDNQDFVVASLVTLSDCHLGPTRRRGFSAALGLLTMDQGLKGVAKLFTLSWA